MDTKCSISGDKLLIYLKSRLESLKARAVESRDSGLGLTIEYLTLGRIRQIKEVIEVVEELME